MTLNKTISFVGTSILIYSNKKTIFLLLTTFAPLLQKAVSTFCSISSKPLRTKTKYKFRNMKSFDKQKFIDDISFLEEKVNHRIHTQSDTEATFAFFTEKFSQIVNKHAPLKESSRKETKLKTKPWITKGILKTIQTKNKLF